MLLLLLQSSGPPPDQGTGPLHFRVSVVPNNPTAAAAAPGIARVLVAPATVPVTQ